MTAMPVAAGVDGSQESFRAAEWAAQEARRRNTGLRLISVPRPVPVLHKPSAEPAEEAAVLRAVSARALDQAVALCRNVAPALAVTAEVLTGPVASTVAQSGDGAALLVVGARGAGGFADMLLGSVSRYVAGCTSCPVVVVGGDTMAVHRKVAVGIRDPQDTSSTLAFAFEEAALRGAELVAVHVWPATLRQTDPEWITGEASRPVARALAGWRDKYPDVPVRCDITQGYPGYVLAGYAARTDLVVIGRHDSPGGSAPGVGTVQHSILGRARGPVAVVPSGS